MSPVDGLLRAHETSGWPNPRACSMDGVAPRMWPRSRGCSPASFSAALPGLSCRHSPCLMGLTLRCAAESQRPGDIVRPFGSVRSVAVDRSRRKRAAATGAGFTLWSASDSVLLSFRNQTRGNLLAADIAWQRGRRPPFSRSARRLERRRAAAMTASCRFGPAKVARSIISATARAAS